jgi:hypothetical protein
MGNNVKPLFSITIISKIEIKSLEINNLPKDVLIAISQKDATVTKQLFSLFSIIPFILAGNF